MTFNGNPQSDDTVKFTNPQSPQSSESPSFQSLDTRNHPIHPSVKSPIPSTPKVRNHTIRLPVNVSTLQTFKPSYAQLFTPTIQSISQSASLQCHEFSIQSSTQSLNFAISLFLDLPISQTSTLTFTHPLQVIQTRNLHSHKQEISQFVSILPNFEALFQISASTASSQYCSRLFNIGASIFLMSPSLFMTTTMTATRRDELEETVGLW